MNPVHIGLLIYCIISAVSSVYLIKHHQRLDQELDNFCNGREVKFDEYLLTAICGYIGLPFSIGGATIMILLLIG